MISFSPKKMLMKLYGSATQAYEVARIMIYSLHSWPFNFWLGFWTTNKEVTLINLNGIKLLIRTKNFFAKSADISMAYECIIRDDYRIKSIKDCDEFILDIGSHIGCFSVFAAKILPRARILCFEPSAANYSILKKNIKLNKVNNVKSFNKAVSSSNQEVSIHVNRRNSAANSMYNFSESNLKVEKVPSISLEKIFKDNSIKKCSFVKMDCEGAEYDILLNTGHKILKRIQLMVIEYHSPKYFGICNSSYNTKNLVYHLSKSGFRCILKSIKHYQGLVIARR
ncbi:MAG: FkbM family methyltransferase [Nanoarchaeota archaeon]